MAVAEIKWSEIVSKKKLKLKQEDFLEIYECLIKVPDKWRDIAIYLRLPPATLKCIEMDNNTAKTKIQAMISEWLYSGKATWENLIDALVKTGVLSRPKPHVMPQQPAHHEMLPEKGNVWKKIWEIKINDLHKAHKAYRLQRVIVQNKLNTYILNIRALLEVSNDISDEVLMGTIEGHMTLKTMFVSFSDLFQNITDIVEIHRYNRELLEKLTDLLQSSSTEACKHLETFLKLKSNLLHKKEAVMISEGPETNEQTDSIELELQHVESYGECIIPVVEESQQDVANALIENSNVKYRVSQIKIMNKRIFIGITCLYFCIASTLYITLTEFTGALLWYFLLLMMINFISYHWIAVVSKLTPSTFFCGAVSAFIYSMDELPLQIKSMAYYTPTRCIWSFFVGMTIASSKDVVRSSSNRNIWLLSVFYSTFITLSWIFIATFSWSTLTGIALGVVFYQYNNSWMTTYSFYFFSNCAVLVPSVMGKFIGEYTTVQCGYLFAAVGGGLTALLVSTVLSSTTTPIVDTHLSIVVSQFDENIHKLRLLQRNLEEAQKELKRILSSLH